MPSNTQRPTKQAMRFGRSHLHACTTASQCRVSKVDVRVLPAHASCLTCSEKFYIYVAVTLKSIIENYVLFATREYFDHYWPRGHRGARGRKKKKLTRVPKASREFFFLVGSPVNLEGNNVEISRGANIAFCTKDGGNKFTS